ncbi:MAG: hypothetical protein ACKOAU_11045, partial [Pirellula sp.]
LALGFASQHRGAHDQCTADEQYNLGGQVTDGSFGDLNQIHNLISLMGVWLILMLRIVRLNR